MKKVQKVLIGIGAIDNHAPAWFITEIAKLATKEDLSHFNTKEEMSSSFHTIIDMLGECATKVELEEAVAPLATKVELAEAVAPLATKVDRLETKVDRLTVDLLFVRKAVSQLQRECLTKEAFEERVENYPTKDAFLNLMDEHARRVSHRDIQDPLFAKAMTDQSDTIASHGKRLKAIETKLAMSGR